MGSALSLPIRWIPVVIRSRQDAPEAPGYPEVHPEVIRQVEFEGGGNIQAQANVNPQDDLVEIIEPQGEVPFNPIPPAFESAQVFDAVQVLLMRSLYGFEGILQTED
ncbi:hypothetical protein BDV93DRAFT_345082 [Ceratobasidium sp. AG-I]|nr:hypothetical protein BDV93DRAFT_345082 [Ceratobasidium sp. AG-I]